MAHLGLVIDCDDNTLTVYHEYNVYEINKTREVLQTLKSNWIRFEINEAGEITKVSPHNERMWNSRENEGGDILLDVHAQIRDLHTFPVLGQPLVLIDDDVDKPWSLEVDWLEDPEDKMAGTQKGLFHDVTVKFIHRAEQYGTNYFRFPIVEVRTESPPHIQMQMPCTPWVREAVSSSLTQSIRRRNQHRGYAKAPSRGVGNRGKDWVHGIVTRQKKIERITWVWSPECGEQRIRNRQATKELKPGDFVYYTKKKGEFMRFQKENSLKESGSFFRSPEEEVCRVIVNFPVPPMQHMSGELAVHDNFFGRIEVEPSIMSRMLGKHGKTLICTHGRTLKVWVAPKDVEYEERRFVEHFWEAQAVHDDIFIAGDPDAPSSSRPSLL